MEKIRIRDAVERGLLQVGQRIETNGDGGITVTKPFKGTIYQAVNNKGEFSVMRNDGEKGTGDNGAWWISKTSPGYIRILEEAKPVGKGGEIVEKILIEEAVRRHLLKVGQRIETNGDGSAKSATPYTGVIYHLDVGKCRSIISVKRDDKKNGGGEDGTWAIYDSSPGYIRILEGTDKEEVKPEAKTKQKGEETMLKTISENYKNTDEALLVEKHFGTDIERYGDNFITVLIVKTNKAAILAEAKRREEEETKKKK